jgi:Protein ChrB, N-terminal
MRGESRSWVLLAYRLPREPSTPRIALWRRLRRLGAVQLLDGLVALPLRPETREQFDWLADEIVEAGGDATIWLADPATAGQARTLAERMRAAAAADYAAVSAAAHGDRRTLRRLRRALHAIRARDYFSPPEREDAEAAVESLAAQLEIHA